MNRTEQSKKVFEYINKSCRKNNYCLNGWMLAKVSLLINNMHKDNTLQLLIEELDLINKQQLENEIKITEEKLKELYENKNNYK